MRSSPLCSGPWTGTSPSRSTPATYAPGQSGGLAPDSELPSRISAETTPNQGFHSMFDLDTCLGGLSGYYMEYDDAPIALR